MAVFGSTSSIGPNVGGTVQPLHPLQTTPATRTSINNTSTQIGTLYAVGSVAGAFSAYQAGQMQKLAYEHEAAVDEINANQIKIEGMFTIADKTTELANTLALQNVMAAASGRVVGEGSLKALEETSVSNLEADIERIKVTGRSKEVATLMASESQRAAGKTAAAQGLLSGASQLTTGAAVASRFIA